MKKFGKSLYAAALAALVLAGCEREPATGPDNLKSDGMVTFSSNIRKPQQKSMGSRVDGDKWQSGDQIGVYMLKEGTGLGNADDVVGGNANRRYQVRPVSAENPEQGVINPYLISEAIYYPLTDPGHQLKFVAYHPYSAQLDENFDIPIDIEDNKPVMYAQTDNCEWLDYLDENVTVTPVPLQFSHKMARITLEILPGEGFLFTELNGMTVDFVNANATGKFNIKELTFSDVQLGDVSFIVNRDIEEQTMSASLIMIPNENDITGRSIVFTHTNSYYPATGTYQLIHQIADGMSFEPGKEYKYTVTVTRNKVEFSDCTIDDWSPVNGDDEIPGDTETLGTRKLRLSASNPNSYVWDRSSILSIPTIKAYGMWIYGPQIGDEANIGLLELGTTEGMAEPVIIWADDPSAADYVLMLSNPVGGYKATIDINYAGSASDPVVPMNMVVGLKIDGEIRWSWHVWVVDPESNPIGDENIKGLDIDGEDDQLLPLDPNNPATNPGSEDYDPELHPKGKSMDVYFMDRNLGAKTAEIAEPGAMGLYYQWGRKDPFTGVTSWSDATEYAKLYTVAVDEAGTRTAVEITTDLFEGLMGNISVQVDDLAQIVTNPGAFVSGNDTWTTVAGAEELWAAQKTAWDPCPEGWMVPAFVSKPTINGGNPVSPWYNYTNAASTAPADFMLADPVQDFTAQYGWNFNLVSNPGTDDQAALYNIGYWPAAGNRAADGTITELATSGNYWSSNNNTAQYSIFFFNQNEIKPSETTAATAAAKNIRCVKL